MIWQHWPCCDWWGVCGEYNAKTAHQRLPVINTWCRSEDLELFCFQSFWCEEFAKFLVSQTFAQPSSTTVFRLHSQMTCRLAGAPWELTADFLPVVWGDVTMATSMKQPWPKFQSAWPLTLWNMQNFLEAEPCERSKWGRVRERTSC